MLHAYANRDRLWLSGLSVLASNQRLSPVDWFDNHNNAVDYDCGYGVGYKIPTSTFVAVMQTIKGI